jgi:DNA-binding transcriptional regulator YdaS (Cro superfamily)
MNPEEALDQAVAKIGSMQLLADQLGVTKGAVSQWKLDGRRIPAEHCPTIERLTDGEIQCEQLRPDVDWAVIRSSQPALQRRATTNPE